MLQAGCRAGPYGDLMIVRRVLGLIACGVTPDANEVDIAVLPHQLAVLRRQLARPRYTPADRMLPIYSTAPASRPRTRPRSVARSTRCSTASGTCPGSSRTWPAPAP